ncbi:ATP-binding response regulator [Sphingomonas lycopersici]|uniref:histidine kinase n=1 Tax=Sphingomonas lycopersici TaxID=2951807 RepID=A0AA41ZJA7_9SPHN|nr:ATP-binding protein [Sphingomonas lycopersici]MCW6537731.1 ATP-binding protein [Sphingomonas lycopersici]
MEDESSTGDSAAEDTELGQAKVRVGLAVVLAGGIWAGIVSRSFAEGHDIALAWLSGAILAASATLFAAIWHSPGVKHWRRALAMAHDYAALTACLILGGFVLLPLYSVLLWVTVGYGLRYGQRYHIIAAALALTSLATTISFTPYWQQHGFMSATFIITTIIVPAYADRLMIRVHRARDAALQANLAKSRFLGQASHDLRQPIHAISLLTACLRDAGLASEQQRMVDSIDKSLRGVAGLFQSLLDVSTLDSGRVRPRIELVRVQEVIDGVIRQNEEAARWAAVALTSVPTKAFVRCDPRLLTTILQNVVSNALKYAPGRRVVVGVRRTGRTLRIEVHDCGDGIADEHLHRIFEEFYQVRARGDRDIEGVGLGLSIVRRMAHLMGLTASIRSRVGHGTVVVISGLRIEHTPVTKAVRETTPVRSALAGLRVLLVEDDEPTLAATTLLLEQWGCAVEARSSVPRDGVTCDVILTDFDLGSGTTGADCIDRVRAIAGEHIPAIVITGHDEAKVRSYFDEPDIQILLKPVRPAELRSVLHAKKLWKERLRWELKPA